MSPHREAILVFVESLLKEGAAVRATAVERDTSSFTSNWFVSIEPYIKWRSSCKLLTVQLGDFSAPWSQILSTEDDSYTRGQVDAIVGALKSIAENVSAGRLARLEDLIFAEAFANLLEQAEYLLEKGYFLAAGVLFRAVLEEKLRRMCDAAGCTPEKPRPTISDFNQSLYKGNAIDKIAFKSVEDMAAVGNDAAHHKATLKIEDVKRLHSNLTDFVRRY